MAGSDERAGDERAEGDGRGRYHHGALRESLIRATEEILVERGVEGFTLREAARRVGVSPAAPAHHFGDVSGLLTEVAILGFEGLSRHLEEGNARGGADPVARLREQGAGYVRFALAHPARFQLMFRCDRLRFGDERLRAAAGHAFSLLEGVVREVAGRPPDGRLDRPTLAAVLGAWSLVHGFSHLALGGEFDRMAGEGGRDAFVAEMLPMVLSQVAAMEPPGQG